MNNYKFFTHKKCEFFPCHKIFEGNEENFNCLFCYCPLYLISDCGGNFKILENGVKDCSNCILPHVKDVGYDFINKRLKLELDLKKL